MVQPKITQIEIMHSRTKHTVQREISLTESVFALGVVWMGIINDRIKRE